MRERGLEECLVGDREREGFDLLGEDCLEGEIDLERELPPHLVLSRGKYVEVVFTIGEREPGG